MGRIEFGKVSHAPRPCRRIVARVDPGISGSKVAVWRPGPGGFNNVLRLPGPAALGQFARRQDGGGDKGWCQADGFKRTRQSAFGVAAFFRIEGRCRQHHGALGVTGRQWQHDATDEGDERGVRSQHQHPAGA